MPLLDPVIGSTCHLLRFSRGMDPPAEGPDYKETALAEFSVSDQVPLLFIALTAYGRQYGAEQIIAAASALNGPQANSFSVLIAQPLIDKVASASGFRR